MKEITLEITGIQQYDNTEEEQMEFVTDGKLYIRKGVVYIMYDESEVSGMEGCKTTIRLGQDSVKMRRTGLAGFNTEMYFEEGKRISSVYETPYGPMGVEILTDYVKNNFDMETCRGSIDVGYQISLEGLAEGRNRITIKVM